MYYRNAQAALVVYDMTKASSLIKAKHWVAELQRQASPGIVIALVGNKLDLTKDGASSGESLSAGGTGSAQDDNAGEEEEEAAGGGGDGGEEEQDARKISASEAKSYADEEGLLFFETSAKTGTNVADVFTAIANAIPESNLKSARGAAGAGAGGLVAGRPGDDSRVNLGERANAGSKDNCAC